MINILSSIPSDITGLFEMFVKGKTLAHGALAALIIIAVILVTIVLVIVLNDAIKERFRYSMPRRCRVGRW